MTRPLALMLALALVSAGPMALAQNKPKKKVDVKKLTSERKDVRNERKKIEAALRKNKSAQRGVKRTIQELDQTLDNLRDSLERTTDRLAESRVEQKRLAGESAVATSKLQDRREQAKRRVRQLYIRGNASLASAFIGSKSLGDLASRRFLFQRVTQRDKELFDEVKSLHETVLRQKSEADALVRRINGLVVDQKARQNQVNETRQEKRQTLLELRDRQIDLEKVRAELEAEEREIEASLAAYYATRGKTTGLKFSGRLGMPVNGRLVSTFGMRKHPILRIVRQHKGIDLSGNTGDPIRSAADGIVISASYMRGYGQCLIIDHGGGISTLYGHCSRLLVGAGARVKRGQLIAKVGATGLATGPHLHFEVRVNGRPVNPLGWL